MRKAWFLLALACVGLGFAGPADGQDAVDEYSLKAAFLYRLCHYVTWPAKGAAGDFHLAVYGKDPFGKTLDQLAGEKKIHDRKIVVHRFRTESDFRPCHLVFVTPDPAEGDEKLVEERLAVARQKTAKNGTFVVADSPSLAAKGAMINFQVRDQRLAFEVNLRALREEGFQMAPNALRLGVIVDGKD